jgi:hypothetical protein
LRIVETVKHGRGAAALDRDQGEDCVAIHREDASSPRGSERTGRGIRSVTLGVPFVDGMYPCEDQLFS